MITLINLGAYDPGVPAQLTLRYASEDYNHPSATGFYEGRLKQPFNVRRDIFGQGRLSGAGSVSAGTLQLINTDGALDLWRDYAFGGQPVEMLIGDDGDEYGDFVTVLVGRVQQVTFDLELVQVFLRDRMEDLRKPIQPNKYAGTNSLPNGLEGTSDLAGRPKPLVFGDVRNVSPPCVNTSRFIYQVNDGPVLDVPAAYDGGASLTPGADYTDQSDMETNAPAAGNYRAWLAGAYIRLGSTPVGAITCDIVEGSPTDERCAGAVSSRIVTADGGIDAGDVDAASVAELSGANLSPLGIWLPDETTFEQALDPVLASVGGWSLFGWPGTWRVGRIEVPGTASFVLRSEGDVAAGDLELLDFKLLDSRDTDRGVPTWQVSLDHDHNWTVQNGDGLAGGVDAERRTWLASANRTVIAEDSAVKTANPLAVQKKIATLLRDPADAQEEADRLLAVLRVRRDFAQAVVKLDKASVEAIDLGQTGTIFHPRFGYEVGLDRIVIGVEYDAVNELLTIDLWG